MRISLARVRLELRRTFRIARSADEFRESIIVRLEDGGFEGLGEAAPSPRYGQSADSAERALASIDGSLLEPCGHIEDALERAAGPLAGEWAALAALDIALHDLLGKKLGAPLHAILGLDPEKTPAT
ncbi:MAG: dipeptide epimerase, partial [Candidatus Krumholzibacteria bacterium]|nr:dipeptide epimerase [Candidatus Krumholzibacteria bacterium]